MINKPPSGAPGTHATKAIQAMRVRDYATAIKHFEKLGKLVRSDAQLAKAAGVAYMQTGNDERAIFFLNVSLSNHASQADVHAALGDIYQRLANKDKTLTHLRKAVALAPGEPELRYKLGLALLGFDQPGDAAAQMRAALEISPGFMKAQLGLGRALTELRQFDEADAALKHASELTPKNYAVAFRIAKLREKQGLRSQAIAHYKDAEILSDHSAPICEALALLELAEGNTNAALDTLQRGLSKSPLDRDLLKNAAELRYEMADPDAFSFYRQALEIRPLANIHADYIARLVDAEQDQNTALELEKYAANFGRGPGWMSLAARHQFSQGAFQDMLTTLSRAPSDHAELSTWKARALLGCGDSPAAQKLLIKLLKQAPRDQFLLSMLSTCYRLNDPVAYRELVDYDALLIQAELDVPKGYASLATFNDVLRETLEELHVTRGNPLSQSVKGGTQTPGNLFNQPHPVIEALKQAFNTTLAREFSPAFFERLSEKHPVSVGRGHAIQPSEAWSIWVTEGGYHKYHVHQRGWYSSAYYVSLPGEMKHSSDSEAQGALAFGKPGLETPENLDADKLITPTEGVLALFPSYFWHGTLPFKSSEPRVVVAFDALPGN